MTLPTFIGVTLVEYCQDFKHENFMFWLFQNYVDLMSSNLKMRDDKSQTLKQPDIFHDPVINFNPEMYLFNNSRNYDHDFQNMLNFKPIVYLFSGSYLQCDSLIQHNTMGTSVLVPITMATPVSLVVNDDRSWVAAYWGPLKECSLSHKVVKILDL